MIDLKHKVALVTGSSKGLGRGIANELANAGADLLITHLDTAQDAEDAKALADSIIAKGNKALCLALNVTDTDSIEGCLASAFKHFPTIDILVNNAGVMQNRIGDKATVEDFDLCYEVNVRGLWSMSRALIPHFKKRGQGKIINIASVAGRRGHLANAYCASKAAVISITQSLAEELGPSNINVNAICPGLIWTDAWKKAEELLSDTRDRDKIEQRAAFNAGVDAMPLKRPQTEEDIGHAVVFLASYLAKNITGQALNVDGGLCMN